MRRASKVDDNQAAIVKALREAMCSVADLSGVGKGMPDLLVVTPQPPRETFLMEVKDGAKPPSARKLTPDQEKFHAQWKGRVVVVTSVSEALAAAGVAA